MGDRDGNVVNLSTISPEERLRRITVEAERLSRLPILEWQFWLKQSAERLGTTPELLKTSILGLIKEREKKAAEDRRIEQRAERNKERAKREEERKAEKEAGLKAKEKAKALTGISQLPRGDQRDAKVAGLAKKLDEDVDALQEELDVIATVEPLLKDVEPWSEAVETAALLPALIAKINKHAVVRPHEALAIALWILLAWVHGVAAHHSPYLVATAADIGSGKSTLMIEVVGKLTPRPFAGGEPTAATVFRVADAHSPTLLFDDVDTLFKRKPDLTSIFNIGYTRGPKIPRTERINGERMVVWYDPFCPKACTMIGTDLPAPLHSRCVLIKMKPKLPKEKIEKPKDDDEFKDLCRKLKRWSDDNASTLKDALPAAGFSDNREYDNWHLQLAIAKLAGTSWRKQALEAAQRLTRDMRKLTWLQLLLAEVQAAFTSRKRKEVLSEDFWKGITANPLSIWHEYNHGTGAITQRQIAHLFNGVDIHPVLIGPRRLSGWREKDFTDAFARHIPRDPLILSSRRKRKRKQK
jgi:Protein of unknown function (DUF3631)